MDNPSSDGAPRSESTGGQSTHTSTPGDFAPRRKSGLLLYALAGLEAGIVGVTWMFACFVVAAFWDGHSIWAVPNLFSTVFYGDFAYQNEFRRTTWAGMAIIVVVYGIAGAVWGCFWRENRKPLLSFFGALTGLAIYYFFFDFVWPHANPLIPLYAPIRQLQVAHILWGAALARSPGYSKQIARALTDQAIPRGADQAEPEIVSGELIR